MYDGQFYVNFSGERLAFHPQMDQIIEEYLAVENEKTREEVSKFAQMKKESRSNIKRFVPWPYLETFLLCRTQARFLLQVLGVMTEAKYKFLPVVYLIQAMCTLKLCTIKIINSEEGAFTMASSVKRKEEKTGLQNKRNEGLPVYLEPLEHTPKAENDIEVLPLSKVNRTHIFTHHASIFMFCLSTPSIIVNRQGTLRLDRFFYKALDQRLNSLNNFWLACMYKWMRHS